MDDASHSNAIESLAVLAEAFDQAQTRLAEAEQACQDAESAVQLCRAKLAIAWAKSVTWDASGAVLSTTRTSGIIERLFGHSDALFYVDDYSWLERGLECVWFCHTYGDKQYLETQFGLTVERAAPAVPAPTDTHFKIVGDKAIGVQSGLIIGQVESLGDHQLLIKFNARPEVTRG